MRRMKTIKLTDEEEVYVIHAIGMAYANATAFQRKILENVLTKIMEAQSEEEVEE